MKSNNAFISMALLFLIFATWASITRWADVSSPVKIGMFAFGFGAGISAGALIVRRKSSLN